MPRQTPDGFRVTASGGKLTIGRGRMYVDGLLAENHGDPADAVRSAPLASAPARADTPYDEAAVLADARPAADGGPHLAYLDVWEREVTCLEDPDLVEIAVGVDTTARVQTAWQVRLLPNTGNANCDSDDDEIPGWLDTIAPSAGRLTSGTIDVTGDDDPCELPPEGGYRGLENQTYRVEVHDARRTGHRDVQVVARQRLGRDPGRRDGLDDRAAPHDRRQGRRPPRVDERLGRDPRRPLRAEPEAGRAAQGHRRRRGADDHVLAARSPPTCGRRTPTTRRSATCACAAGTRPASIKDGAGNQLTDLDASGASGLITVPSSAATQVVLEHGVVVSFSLASGGSGRFRSGDYWIFAARTADASVEELDAAPPLGIHHHYARLGFVTFPGSQTDCRRLWPPLGDGGDSCECTVCVHPGEHPTLQEARRPAEDDAAGRSASRPACTTSAPA